MALVLLAVPACESSRPFGPREVARLDAAQERWLARPFADYQYEIRTLCFCVPEVTQWTRVTVEGGVVVAAEPVDADAPYAVTDISYWQPIDSLFSRLRRTLLEHETSDFYASIAATYDPVLGYPVTIDYRAKPNIADGGATHALRNVVAH